MKFRYKTYEDHTNDEGDLVLYPLVRVTLKHGRKSVELDCLVDSGASDSLFSVEIADALGIDLSKARQNIYLGIGETTVVGYKAMVQMRLSGFDQWISVSVGFTSQNDMSLLGHSGFFENYEITFRAYSNQLEIRSRNFTT